MKRKKYLKFEKLLTINKYKKHINNNLIIKFHVNGLSNEFTGSK